MKALIDADVIAYQAGFASDIRDYELWDGKVLCHFKYKKDALDMAKRLGSDPNTITKTVKSEPLSHCLHSVNKMIEGIVTETDSDEYQLFLTGEGNFRDAITPSYKANRTKEKPTHFLEIREHMINTKGAIVVDGAEADDALGALQWLDLKNRKSKDYLDCETVICTIDKDLNMIPGLHYNWGKQDEGIVIINQEEADLFFFEQMLTGDAADNIAGIKGIGSITAKRLLKNTTSNQDSLRIVKDTWKKALHVRVSPDTFLESNAHLLWITRDPDLTWQESLGVTL